MKKKNILFFLIILILCIILFFFLYHKDQKNNTSKLTIPIPVQWETPAGIKVLYFEDNEIPIVRANLYMESFLDDTDNPFGATIKPEEKLQMAQRHYIDKNGSFSLVF